MLVKTSLRRNRLHAFNLQAGLCATSSIAAVSAVMNVKLIEMRYWSMREICDALERASFRNLRVRVDGYFSQNPQLSDLDLLSLAGGFVVRASHAARQLAKNFPCSRKRRTVSGLKGMRHPAVQST